MPPEFLWCGSPTEMDRMMEQAIKDGRATTADDLYKAQGMRPSPPGALI
jgi:hypothetical protein